MAGACSTATGQIEAQEVGASRVGVNPEQVATLRAAGASWPVVFEILSIGVGTACQALQP